MNTTAENIIPSTLQYLMFNLDKEEFGVDILHIKEIRPWEHPTPIPYSAKFIRGMINLRGTVIPIIDLRNRLNLSPLQDKLISPNIIVLQTKQEKKVKTMGIIVDKVSQVYNLSSADIKPVPILDSPINKKVLQGVATLDDKLVIILDVSELFDFDDVN